MIPPLTAMAERATVRLVPTAYYKPPVLRPLVDHASEVELLARLEGLTSQRLLAAAEGLPDLDRRELAFRAREDQLRHWGHTFVNAAFAYTRAGGNRFNDHCRGALLADFIGDFPDLRTIDPRPDCLHPDPAIGYPAGQRLAVTIRAAGHDGLLYPSVRRPGGTCLVAFAPQTVQSVRPGAKWRLTWNGDPAFTAAVET